MVNRKSNDNQAHRPPIRSVCLQPGDRWQRPTGDEVRTVLGQAELSGNRAAALLGLGKGGGRTVRRWTEQGSSTAGISYAAWAILCHAAGYGVIYTPNAQKSPTPR